MGFWSCLLYLAIIGSMGFIIGRLIPKSWFHWDRIPFRDMNWERKGKIYEAVLVKKWQNLVPDMSRILPGIMPPKKMTAGTDSKGLNRMVQETCVAEAIHILLIVAGFRCLKIWKGIGGTVVALLYLVGNLPFIIIQRYNRPRLVRLMMRRQVRLEEVEI